MDSDLQPPAPPQAATDPIAIESIQLQPLQAPSAGPALSNDSTTIQNIPSYFQIPTTDDYQSPYANGDLSRASSLVATPVFSKETSEVIARVKANGVRDLTHGSSEWETAKQAVRAEMDFINTNPTPANPNARTGGRRGRGPRRRGSPIAAGSITLTSSGAPSTPKFRGRGRGGRPRGSRGGRGVSRGTKRKRARDSDDDNSSTSSEEINSLPSQSRSGRKIFQASNSTPIIKIDPEEPQQSPLRLSVPSPLPKTTPKKVIRKTPGASAVCKNCQRGHSPMSNAIVFCDGCNTPWHQYCHEPPIKADYLLIADKEWFCSDCIVLREEKGRLQGKVPGDGMSLLDKRKYLQTLSHGTLVSLLLHASSLDPSLPIYAPKTTLLPISPNAPSNVGGVAGPAIVDEEEYYTEDELPYPKAGNGVILPLESENFGILVDDDTVTYSHRWEGISEMMAEVSKFGMSSPFKNGLGVRTGAGGQGSEWRSWALRGSGAMNT